MDTKLSTRRDSECLKRHLPFKQLSRQVEGGGGEKAWWGTTAAPPHRPPRPLSHPDSAPVPGSSVTATWWDKGLARLCPATAECPTCPWDPSWAFLRAGGAALTGRGFLLEKPHEQHEALRSAAILFTSIHLTMK